MFQHAMIMIYNSNNMQFVFSLKENCFLYPCNPELFCTLLVEEAICFQVFSFYSFKFLLHLICSKSVKLNCASTCTGKTVFHLIMHVCLLKSSRHPRLRQTVSKCTIFSFYLKISRAVNLGVKETICKAWLGIAIIDWSVCLSLHPMMKVEHVAYE